MSHLASIFPRPGPPKSRLGHYRLLAPNASVRVSPLCLGTMNFGDAWKEAMGECNKETTYEILDFYYQNGGNFIDTANNYQKEESEQWVGEWMKDRGVRDEIVLATKFTTNYRAGYSDKEIIINRTGNGTKSLHLSLEASLKKLQTTYIDLLYVHWWDFTCSIEELMQSLDVVVKQGKVLYLGISDTPAWIVAKCNEYARQKGLRQFSVYQGQWSAEKRSFERDIIPMTVADGMGLAPWGVLGGGNFKSEEQRKETEGRNFGGPGDSAIAVSKVLEKIAKRKNTLITSVALAYVFHKTPYVFPIIGGRKVSHLKGNIEALSLRLSDEEIDEIEDAYPFDIGFPQSFLGGPKGVKNPGDVPLMGTAGKQEHVLPLRPILPSEEDESKEKQLTF